MKRTITRRFAPEVNAGSMADIAFLLLIFFLVTTTILSDAGILVKLPPWDDAPPPIEILGRNALRVVVNGQNELLVENERIPIAGLKEKAKEFIMNPDQLLHLAEQPNKAIISLINDRSTSYDTYLSVYNELKAAYNELWQAAAQREYGQNYLQLTKAQKREIHRQIPFVISEAEPTDLMQAT